MKTFEVLSEKKVKTLKMKIKIKHQSFNDYSVIHLILASLLFSFPPSFFSPSFQSTPDDPSCPCPSPLLYPYLLIFILNCPRILI